LTEAEKKKQEAKEQEKERKRLENEKKRELEREEKKAYQEKVGASRKATLLNVINLDQTNLKHQATSRSWQIMNSLTTKIADTRSRMTRAKTLNLGSERFGLTLVWVSTLETFAAFLNFCEYIPFWGVLYLQDP